MSDPTEPASWGAGVWGFIVALVTAVLSAFVGLAKALAGRKSRHPPVERTSSAADRDERHQVLKALRDLDSRLRAIEKDLAALQATLELVVPQVAELRREVAEMGKYQARDSGYQSGIRKADK